MNRVFNETRKYPAFISDKYLLLCIHIFESIKGIRKCYPDLRLNLI